jgi:hypothetical protein
MATCHRDPSRTTWPQPLDAARNGAHAVAPQTNKCHCQRAYGQREKRFRSFLVGLAPALRHRFLHSHFVRIYRTRDDAHALKASAAWHRCRYAPHAHR